MTLSIKEKYSRQERRNHLKEMSSKRQVWYKIINITLVHCRITKSLYLSINEHNKRQIRYEIPSFNTYISFLEPLILSYF